MSKNNIPTYDEMMNPLLRAMKKLGGSGTVEEINSKVAEILGLQDEQLDILHDSKRGGQTEFEYRLAWTRSYLKRYGILENSSRGVWALTPEGRNLTDVNEKEVVRVVRGQLRAERLEATEVDEESKTLTWQEELLETLMKMEPDAFERLIQRFLRESGFIQVEVTGRSGDGGIDGRGIMRLGGLLSFHVIFQCKRWQGAVRANQVRDFRGAMVGRADKGLLVTTGTFTKDAVWEATRDGAPAIDLIDGDQLVEKLRELALGVKTEKIQVEKVSVDKNWFASL
ncbi:restriction endonuclease [Bellilinea caldifistulae]|uniref:Restriction endonuclease n=1 Tax=Bellilinea caldifistulae TaxID=360411 RepID=A0A0N8GNI3_9CHLR|nr:restriction endonuclease [Bellilinea caldifistulae]KPL78178.1 restriction endonuclease [Bellilinea caldifistulae]GAP09286.1 restriction endonuclease [Bellilinea caldifistulae]